MNNFDNGKFVFAGTVKDFVEMGDKAQSTAISETRISECPECHEGITELNSYSEIVQTFSLTSDGRADYFGLNYCAGDGCYTCPECDEKLFDNELDAVKFLKGERSGRAGVDGDAE